ncbi:hypothetical protein FIU83_10575 [Halomonas sp. THAF5a]|uniref:hypothetical protein n=1 Tax=Halomonas sp. THAF5a TaxID=2587844 RepID=UPI0012685D83|nr:hypothetical protein [Halomonas sp. THAF5a]QFU02084.1 hypothetical protein FIU83_10575 [Halomonas sp. THAF5a]
MRSSLVLTALAISLAGLSTAASALASPLYENDAGQSAQLTHFMTHKVQVSATAIATWSPGDNRYSSTDKTMMVESFRQDHALGQSDALSKSRPYAELAKGIQAGPKTSFTVETSTYHDNEDRIGNPLDW